jgi:hypothetical protein
VAMDCPKLASGCLKFAKSFHTGGLKQIYHALLQQSLSCRGGVVYDEILRNDVPLPLTFDVEIKRLDGYNDVTF